MSDPLKASAEVNGSEPFAEARGSAARMERIHGGICDVCGREVPALNAIYAAPVAGVCVCDECLKPPNADLRQDADSEQGT